MLNNVVCSTKSYETRHTQAGAAPWVSDATDTATYSDDNSSFTS